MITHIVTFKWHQGTDPDGGTALARALDAFVAGMPGLLSYRHGPAVDTGRGNADYAVVAVFDSPHSLGSYLDHPEHQRIVRDIVTPMLGQRHSVQIAMAEGENRRG